MFDRIRVRMLQSHDSLQAGDEVNLPEVIAARLIAERKAVSLAVPPARPAENKAVVPEQNKTAKAPRR